MKKTSSIILSTILLFNTFAFANELQMEDIAAVVEQEIANQTDANLKEFVVQVLSEDIQNPKKFDELSNEEKEAWADLYTTVYLSSFTQSEVTEIMGFLMFNMGHDTTGEIFNMFAGLFLIHKDFMPFRERMVMTVGDPRLDLREDKNVKFLTPYIKVLKEAPDLDVFPNEGDNAKIIPVLERRIRELSYLGQVPYNGSGTLLRRSTYLNEYAANRCFLEAYSYFAYREDQSLLKGFVTPMIPIPHSPPSRNLRGQYLDDAGGRAHALAFDMEDMLIRHYILTGQDNEVYRFIEDNGQRQGPFYFQFAVDGLSLATLYYESLTGNNSAARQQWWEEKSEELVDVFKSESPSFRRNVVIAEYGLALALEYHVFKMAFEFVGNKVLSPLAKAAFSMLPKNTQLRLLTRAYVFRGYVRQGIKTYLHDKPRFIYRSIIGRITGKRFLLPEPRAIGASKAFLEESLRRAGYAEDSEIYKFFVKHVKDFNKADENTYNYLRNLTDYIPKQDFEDFYALYQRIPAKYKGEKPFVRIVAINGKIAPEVENRVITNSGQVLANINDLLKQQGRVMTAEYPGDGKVYSILHFENGTQIRFGAHEIDGRKIHVHFEKQIEIGGMPYKLNKSFLVNTRKTMRVLMTDNIQNLWLFSTEAEHNMFIKTLYRMAKNENLGMVEEKFLGNNMKNYIYRLNDYFFGDPAQRSRAISRLMIITNKSTEQEAIDETLSRVLATCYYSEHEEVSSLTKKYLLFPILQRMSTDMTNQEAAELFQLVLIENIANPTLKGFSALSATSIKGAATNGGRFGNSVPAN